MHASAYVTKPFYHATRHEQQPVINTKAITTIRPDCSLLFRRHSGLYQEKQTTKRQQKTKNTDKNKYICRINPYAT